MPDIRGNKFPVGSCACAFCYREERRRRGMIRVIIAGLLMVSGLFVLGIATVGIFRFSTMLNRIHVAAKCDTLGALLVLSGLIVLSGWNVFSLKLGLVIVFLWLCNPAASHLVARAEVKTNPNLGQICDFVGLTGETAKEGENK